jgi:hypothetical protein
MSGATPAPAPARHPAPEQAPTKKPVDEPAESGPATSLCYALSYQACGADGENCDVTPAAICAQPDERWLMTDGTPGALDPQTDFLPGKPGMCYRVYRKDRARPLCTDKPGSPTTVWTLR